MSLNRPVKPVRALTLLGAALVALTVLVAPTGTATARAAAAAASTTSAPNDAPVPLQRASRNPLAGGTWGVYTGGADGVYPAWAAASGSRKRLLARVAQQPRVRWFGAWVADVTKGVREYIAETQDGDPNVLVQMAMFRLFPDGEWNKDRPLSKADRNGYRRWVDAAARGIGSSRVAMILEPDLAVALKGWRPSVRLQLTAYAAKVFGSLPNTAVYIDASDADWLKVPAAVSMLRKAGVRHVRGFALGATHYASTPAQVKYGRKVVAALARAGIPHRHFVIDTADNGRPFTWLQFYKARPRGDFDNAPTCRTRSQKRCVTLGIPPTSRVSASRWGLPERLRPVARRHVDGYLWFGRPWLVKQASPFSLTRTLAVARTTPFQR